MTAVKPDSILTCRRATADDRAFLIGANRNVALDSEDVSLCPDAAQRGIEWILAHPDAGHYWLLEDPQKNTPIGSCLITVEWSDWHAAPYWWLQSVYIDSCLRGNGLFATFCELLEAEARLADVRELRLYVDKHNTSAIKAYDKTGFETGHYQMMTKTL